MCVLLEQDPARKLYATGHHNIVNVPGTDEWIIAYHRFAYNPAGRWAGGDGCHRKWYSRRLTTILTARWFPSARKLVPTCVRWRSDL